MECPNCENPRTEVLESRKKPDTIRRRRECKRCGTRFTTYEEIDNATIQKGNFKRTY